jgi:NADH-quinone oxidoreductase subunit D
MFFEEFPAWKEFENLFERNRIFIDRTINVGYNC